jgi:membrane-bound inhibitor of C-type lysozyme
MAIVILSAGLAACSTPRDNLELSKKTVEYQCGPGGEQPLTVEYTFQGAEALAAKVIYRNQAVDLTRSTSSNADMVGNTFRGNGYSWTTGKFGYENVGDAYGNMLTQDVQQTAGGQNATVSNILVKDCKPISTTDNS